MDCQRSPTQHRPSCTKRGVSTAYTYSTLRMAGMSAVPCMEDQLSPRPDSVTSTLTTKSRIHSLFHWRKASNVSRRPSTRCSDQHVSGLRDPALQITRPRLNSRKASERSVSSNFSRPRSADNQMSRKHDRMIYDPPPLAQVHGQSLLHAQLEAPTSFTEKPRYTTHTSKDGHTRGFSEEKIEVKRSHKRTPSGESTCSTQEKMFFLINGPYILQYDRDSGGDAQPEKILILDQNSVAIACDAVPGRPWVLQISKPQLSFAKTHSQTLRPSWSRMTLRQAADRRAVNTMLLVFNDSEELYTWLFAVRKEIENLGGLEYRPDGEDDQAWRENLTRKFAAGSDAPSDMLKYATSNIHASPESIRKRRGVKDSSRFHTHSVRSSTSSKQTSTSLDRLRDSVLSDGRTSTLATSCADGSASSLSPTTEAFPGITSVTDHSKGDLFLRNYTRNSGGSARMSTSPKPSRSLLERRKLSVGSLNFSGSEDGKDKTRKYLPDLPSTISASPLQTPPPIDKRSNNESPSIKDTPATNFPSRPLTRNASTTGSTGSVPKAKYSLFPVCPPPEHKNEVIGSPPALSKPLPVPAIVEPPRPQSRSRANSRTEARHQTSKSRTVVLELQQHRVSALLGAGEFAQPQRSPAVTDEMIMSNFGMALDKPPASPLPATKVPGLSDLVFDMDFLKMPYRAPSTRQASAPRVRRSSSTKSVSSTRHGRSTSLAKVPAGPPPAGPLPEVPSHYRESSRTYCSSHPRSKSRDGTTDQQGVASTDTRDVVLPTSASLYEMLRSSRSEETTENQTHDTKARTRSRSRGRRRTDRN